MVVEKVIDSNVIGPISFEDFASFHNDLATSIVYDTVLHESTSIVHDHDNEEEVNENNSVDDNSDLPLPSKEDVCKALDILQRYMSGTSDMPIDMCEKVDPVAQYVALRSAPKLKERKLSDFFK
jgi:hypothetical protein